MIPRALMVPTVPGRQEGLRTLLASIGAQARLDEWAVLIVGQAFSEAERADMKAWPEWSRVHDAIWLPEGIGCFAARLKGLAKWDAGTFVNLDDDMEMLPETNYAPMEAWAARRGNGLCSGNWVRSPTPGLLKRAVRADEFKVQSLVYTAGGMLYSRATADLIRGGLRPGLRMFDDCEWSLFTYLQGLQNARYLGSLAVHRVCSAGGHRAFLAKAERIPPDSRWLTLRSGAGKLFDGKNNVLMPVPADLKPAAHEAHRAARARWA